MVAYQFLDCIEKNGVEIAVGDIFQIKDHYAKSCFIWYKLLSIQHVPKTNCTHLICGVINRERNMVVYRECFAYRSWGIDFNIVPKGKGEKKHGAIVC